MLAASLSQAEPLWSSTPRWLGAIDWLIWQAYSELAFRIESSPSEDDMDKYLFEARGRRGI